MPAVQLKPIYGDDRMLNNLEELFIEIGERSDWPECYDKVEIVRSRIDCYADKLIEKYDPIQMWDFKRQVERWLNNIDDVDEKFMLLNSLTYFTFFNRDHYEALYREALNGVIAQWLIDINRIDICTMNLDANIEKAIGSTLFSAATDSMEISAFCHTNGITNKERSVWFGEIDKEDTLEQLQQKANEWSAKLKRWGRKQVVVLEDFIGSGKQIKPLIDFLASMNELKTLIVPLTICPQGDYAIRKHIEQNNLKNVFYAPVTVLPDDLVLGKDTENRNEILIRLKKFAQDYHDRVIGTSRRTSPTYLGFGGIGALFAKYTNCPNNSLPLFWYSENEDWTPLFRRNERKNDG